MKEVIKAELKFPDETIDQFQGGIRHRFTFKGRDAWVVEPIPFYAWEDSSNWDEENHTVCNPHKEISPRKWFWLPEWPTAFPDRNGVKELLELGYTMIHVNVYDYFGNPEAVEIMHDFYTYLRSFNFAEKGALIGMSLGGLYSFRYAATYPESVACIYADAPVCDFACYTRRPIKDRLIHLQKAYGVEDVIDHPLAPVNNFTPIAKAQIPILLILGMDDAVIPPEENGELLARRFAEAGGTIEVLRRNSWGHHPHGLQNPAKILRFILRYIG